MATVFLKSMKVLTGLGIVTFVRRYGADCQATDESQPENRDYKLYKQKVDLDSSELKLVGAFVFFRHGARTPLRRVCMEETVYDAAKLLYKDPQTRVEYYITDLNRGPPPASVIDKVCKRTKFKGNTEAGVLTHVGREQCYLLGQQLKTKYIDSHHLVDEYFDDEHVYFRSTNMSRTIDSLECVAAGLFDKKHRSGGPIRFHVAKLRDEILFPNFPSCAVLQENEVAVSSHIKQQPGMQFVLHYIQSFANRDDDRPECEGSWMHPGMNASVVTWRDHLKCRKVHGLTVPFWLEVIEPLLENHAAYMLNIKMCGLPGRREKILRLSVGPVLFLVMQGFKGILEKDPFVPCLQVFSGHDSGMAPLLEIVGQYTNVWPPFACNLAFDLYKHEVTGNAFVQICYNGEPIVLKGHKSTLIGLDEFEKFLSPYIVDRMTYYCECCQTYLAAGAKNGTKTYEVAPDDEYVTTNTAEPMD